jgi:6-phosphofructokinase 1
VQEENAPVRSGLTLRGNLLVVHGGGPTAVLNASLYGVIREAFRHPEIQEIYGARFGNEGLLAGNFVDLRRQAAEKLDRLPRTPGSALGSSRRRIELANYEAILQQLRHRNIRFLLFNGGNGTMMLASEITRFAAAHGWEMRVMGIPKTVDNDIVLTDHCPGYGSAARYLAVTALELWLDNEALPFPVEILETIGRNTGWLAAATVLGARGPGEAAQLVYVPEIPFETGRFLADVESVYRRMGRVVAVVAEGVRNARGEPMGASPLDSDRDGFGRIHRNG